MNLTKIKYISFLFSLVIISGLSLNSLLPIRNVGAASTLEQGIEPAGEIINPMNNVFPIDYTLSYSSSILQPAILKVFMFNHATCALFVDGVIKCWGKVDDHNSDQNPLVYNFLETTSLISIGWGHSCLVTEGGAAKCWGRNAAGQLGDGTHISSTMPVDVVGLSSGVIAISAKRHEYTCALTDQGKVLCWGNDTIFHMYATPHTVPTLESGVLKIDSGESHTCALTGAHGVRCWGRNYDGQIGDGTVLDRVDPVLVTGLSSGVKDIFLGYEDNTCALMTNGAVKCWGNNSFGKLGDGSTINRLTPVDVSSTFGVVKEIALGVSHTCVLSNLGGVKCWGDNNYGQLGDGTTTNSLTPVNVGGFSSGVTSIFAGQGYTCALLDSGIVKCWGSYPSPAEPSSTPIEMDWDNWFSISGTIKDDLGNPRIGVLVSLDTGQTTTTDSVGFFEFFIQEPLTVTITPSLSGYRFAPENATLNLASNSTQDFIVRHEQPEPFLYLPLSYPSKPGWTTEQLFAYAAMGSNNGLAPGYVNSWFDHKTPKYNIRDGFITTWRGTSLPDPPLPTRCKYGSNCYDSHNGIDFRHTITEDQTIFTSFSGTVVDPTIYPNKIVGYGNAILIDHHNGYASFYGHLKRIDITVGQEVSEGTPIGIMGNTGEFEMGVHLHFGVYYDKNGDHHWDENEVVDPFGWQPLGEPGKTDPWNVDSFYLWKYSNSLQCSVTSAGITQNSPTGMLTIEIPAGAVISDVTLDLYDLPPASETSASLRFTGQSFFTQILEWLTETSISQSNTYTQTEVTGFTQPVTMTVDYDPTQLNHLNLSNLALYFLDSTGTWVGLPSLIDTSNHTVTAQTTEVGNFTLQAPLLCPTATQEPNDNYDGSISIPTNSTLFSDSFDIQTDEDWYRFEAITTNQYLIKTTNLNDGVDTTVQIYDMDGVSVLTTDDNSGGNFSSQIQWEAPHDGFYFVRVIPTSTSVIGCDASYDIGITKLIPLIAPVLTSPEDDLSINDNTPTFSWEAVTDGDHYQIQVSQLSDFSSIIFNVKLAQGVHTYTASLLGDGRYFWHVRAITFDDINGFWSSTGTFSIDTVSPIAPTLISPLSDASLRGVPTYTWNADLDAVAYYFQYDDNSDFSSPVFTSAELTSTSYKPPLQTPGTYYWHVKARDTAGNWSNWSDSRTITIKPLIPVAPVLVSPASGKFTNDNTPTFKWKSVPDGYKYRIQISKTSAFTLPVFKNIVLNPGVLNYTTPKLADGKYFWRVMAINVLNEGKNWSVIRNFTVDTIKPAAPVLSSPANGASATYIPTYKWQAVTGVKYYQLSYAKDTGFSQGVFTSTKLTALSFKPTTQAQGTWYWRVRAQDAAGNWSNWSLARKVTIK